MSIKESNTKKNYSNKSDKNTKVALLPGLLGARKLYKIGKSVMDKTKFDDKVKEKIYKSKIMKDVGKKVKDNFPHLKKSIDKKISTVNKYLKKIENKKELSD
jgi:hypothetical protein